MKAKPSERAEGDVEITVTLPRHIVAALTRLGHEGSVRRAIIMLVEHELSEHPSLRSQVQL